MATNTLGVYNPTFYAQEALIHLEKALGMAGRVPRGIDQERRAFGKGETINIRKPSTFSAGNAPVAASDLATQTVTLTLSYWREVKFELTDKELAFTGERIIEDHIKPAAYALADDIDQKLAALYVNIPWFYDLSGTPTVADVTGPHQVLFDNAVPTSNPMDVSFMMNGAFGHSLLGLQAFSQVQGAGEDALVALRRATLGVKFGMECFMNQNTPSHTPGTIADTAGEVDGEHLAGVTEITIDALNDAETVVAGDTFVIAGNTQRYAMTTGDTVGGNEVTVSFTPALVATAAASAVVTIRGDSHVSNLAFHKNAFALAMAPLSDLGGELGAKVATITDPVTGLAIRSRMFYIGDSSKVVVALDVLYGVACLDPNLAVRACG